MSPWKHKLVEKALKFTSRLRRNRTSWGSKHGELLGGWSVGNTTSSQVPQHGLRGYENRGTQGVSVLKASDGLVIVAFSDVLAIAYVLKVPGA